MVLHYDALAVIFSLLRRVDVLQCRAVCRDWRRAAEALEARVRSWCTPWHRGRALLWAAERPPLLYRGYTLANSGCDNLPQYASVVLHLRIRRDLLRVNRGPNNHLVRVGMHYTTDGWKNTYKPMKWAQTAANPPLIGDHMLTVLVERNVSPTERLWFALCVLDTDGRWHWDNNGGWNYEIHLAAALRDWH